ISFDERELVPLAKSRFSISATESPRDAASSATPAPVIPPPITATSNTSPRIRSRFADRVRSDNSCGSRFPLIESTLEQRSRASNGEHRGAWRLSAKQGTMLRGMAGPLEGIRVIDFGRFIAGPYCAMLLADFGADVIRVERREGGEDRKLGPVTESGEGGLFLNCNRNKRGITLDLGQPQASDVIRRLAGSADIVVVNLPLAVMKRVGLDYDSLRAVNETIILVMASAFGPDGPYTDRVGFDGIIQAMSGAMGLTGFPGPPIRSV